MPDIPDAPPGWYTAEFAALHQARTDGGLRARIAAALWTRDYQPGPEAEIGGYVYDIADRVAGVVEELVGQARREAAEQARAEERAAIARIRRLHFQYRGPSNFDSCAHCNRSGNEVPWPCDTIKTLNGTLPGPQPPGADELLNFWRAGWRMGENRA